MPMSNDNLIEFLSHYADKELCQRWNNNIPASELDTADYDYFEQSQELQFIYDTFTFLPFDDITGFIVKYGDRDFKEIYVTESSRPYDLQAIYHPLSYYVE